MLAQACNSSTLETEQTGLSGVLGHNNVSGNAKQMAMERKEDVTYFARTINSNGAVENSMKVPPT